MKIVVVVVFSHTLEVVRRRHYSRQYTWYARVVSRPLETIPLGIWQWGVEV